MTNTQKVYVETQLRNIKRAKLKFLESKLQLQKKNNEDVTSIHQTMKDINKIKKELNQN